MAIEITRNMRHSYRINPDDPRIIDRRENKHGARWKLYRLCESASAAKDALLKLQKDRT